MPYHINTVAPGKFEVVDDSGKVAGTHPTRKQALAQLKALYANVPEAKKEASDMEQTEKASSDPGDYLIAEDREHPTTWHLQVRTNGKPDHRLMGAAWAALHEGYRGNKYEGPDKGAALDKLKKLYKAEDMPLPGETESVKKEAPPSILDRVIATLKGDSPGHPFRGNQFEGGSGGSGGRESDSGLSIPSSFPGVESSAHSSMVELHHNVNKAHSAMNKIDRGSLNGSGRMLYDTEKHTVQEGESHISSAQSRPRMGSRPTSKSTIDAVNNRLKNSINVFNQLNGSMYQAESKEGRRNSTPDGDRLQQIHDLAVLNGASCPMVMKEASGKLRWVLLSSNAFMDSDKEIISTKALEADVARTDKAAAPYGPLRWWHMGAPDPIALNAGSGADIGDCDYRAMSGRVLIESGTFRNERIGEAIKQRADTLAGSIGFFHPKDEPDSEGVYRNVVTFERSLLPRGKASNTLTALTVKGDWNMATSKEKQDALAALLGDQSLAEAVIKQAEQTEKAADDRGLKYKEQEKPAEVAPVAPEVEATTKAPTGEPTAVPAHGESGLMKAFGLSPDDDEATCKEKIGKVLNAMMEAKMAASAKETAEKEAGLNSKIAALETSVKELMGDVPRGLQSGFRASIADATILKDINFKNAPTGDPLDSVIDQLMGVKK